MEALTEMIRHELGVYKLKVSQDLGREASFYETCCKWIDDGRFDHYLGIIKAQKSYEDKPPDYEFGNDTYSNISDKTLTWQETQELLEYR